MGSNGGTGVENDGENGEGPGADEDESKKGDTSPFFTFHTTGGGGGGVGGGGSGVSGSNNNHNSLTGDEHGLMLSTSDQFHSRYIDITLPEDLENGDMSSRVITSYINSSPSHTTTLNSGGGVSGGGGQLNFFYDATNNFQAQHEINENIIGQDRNTPKLSPTGSSGQCPKGVLTNGLILLNQAQSSEDMILDGIDADFVTSAKVVFKTNNNNNNNHHHHNHHNHLGRIREDATLSSNVHGSSRIVQLHGGVYEQQKGSPEKKRSDYYASKYSSSHENPYHEDGHHNNNNNNNGSLGEEKQLKQQPHTEYLDLQSVNDVVAQSSASHHQNSNNNHSNNNKYQSRKRECSDGTRSPGVSMSSLENEEINTKELAQKISAELKRYSIPQAIFAQRVLCRSQVSG